MKFGLVLGAIVLAGATHQSAGAATLSMSDFDVISVVPRSASVKPLVMPIPAKASNKQLASKARRAA